MVRAAGDVSIGVLGPVVVRLDGRPVDVGGPKSQIILAMLAHHLGERVGVDDLIDAMWRTDPPRSARNVVQVRVSELRSALGPGFDLHTERGGYRLGVDGVEVDASSFERLATTGVDLLADDPVHALDSARQALGLWRGLPAATELDIEPLAGRIASLDDLRTRVRLLEIDALLRLGRHEDACAIAAGLVSEHPFREDARCLHLVALYRCGRQTEALSAYRACRDLLVGELGVEPGPDLRDLHRRILEQDPGLDGSPRPGAGSDSSGGSLPTDNLRAEPNELVPRPEIDDVVQRLVPGRLVTVVGAGGIGKSRSVSAVARRCRDEGTFPDGVWLVDLASIPDGADDVATTVAASIGLGQHPELGPAETVVTYLAHRRALLVLDNCEHVAPAVTELVRLAVGHAPDLAVLAASRVRLDLSFEVVVSLGRLPDDSAVRLLTSRIAEAGAGPFTDDECVELCRALDNYPLAIELAATRLRVVAPREIVSRLGDHPDLLRSPGRSSAGGRRYADLAAALDWSLGQLSVGALEALGRSTVFVSDFDLESAEAVLREGDNADDGDADVRAGRVVDHLGELVEHHLVSRDHGRARFRVLEPIRQHLSGRAPARAHARYSTRYADLAIDIARGLRGPDEAVWWDRVRADLPHVREVVRRAIDRRDVPLLEGVFSETALTSRICGFTEPGEWAVTALAKLDVDPVDVPGIAIAAATHHAQHKQHGHCERLLDVLEPTAEDDLTRASILSTRLLNDVARTELVAAWREVARTCGDPAMHAIAEIHGSDPSMVEIADRLGNPTLRVNARQFLSARVLTDVLGDEARRNKHELFRIALTSNNEMTIAHGQAFMALQHCFDGAPERASPLAADMVERYAKIRSPMWVWGAVEIVGVLLAIAKMHPVASATLWAAVTESGTIPVARLTRRPEWVEWVESELTDEELRRAVDAGAALDMDAAAREARKAAEMMA